MLTNCVDTLTLFSLRNTLGQHFHPPTSAKCMGGGTGSAKHHYTARPHFPENVKTRISILTLIPILAGCGVIFFAGCASMEINKTASLLSAAGFRVHTPQTPKEKELYATFPSNKLERGKVKGKVFYVFKDEKAGVEYVGGEAQHRRYQQLCMEQHVAPAPEEQMNDFFTGSWARQLGHDYSG